MIIAARLPALLSGHDDAETAIQVFIINGATMEALLGSAYGKASELACDEPAALVLLLFARGIGDVRLVELCEAASRKK